MELTDKINKIVEEYGQSIVVLKGFDTTNLPAELKYFSFNIQQYDSVDLENLRREVIKEIVSRTMFESDYLWMTIEEYQLFKEQDKINAALGLAKVILLENNLYYRQFPYQNTLSNIDDIYHYLYYQEDNELEPNQINLLNNVSTFYGRIDFSKDSGNYYVTYPEESESVQIVDYYNVTQQKPELTEDYPTTNVDQIELSDDELPLLDLTQKIKSHSEKKDIVFIISSTLEQLPHEYLKRISILTELTQGTFYFTTPSIRRSIIKNEAAYLDLLKRTYGYSKFKEIEFYQNIKSRSKETIEISQAQIIDDIITQAENAMNGDPFRDIYVTASTGAGKSVMFQIPALYLSEIYSDNKPLTLVISPLIGLMNDQVSSMKKKGIENSATINGNTPPYEKTKILEKIQNNQVDILYLSPETLQARNDIKTLIGDRTIGVVIIDEAHIVTTWGKSFRADYWYLGIYLAKLRKQYKFPIVTFTATAIYGGKEDMYLDTLNSLNMISPISYFGVVRRNDIYMKVRSSQKDFEKADNEYRKTKQVLTANNLLQSDKNHQKTLVYFPTVTLLQGFYSFLEQNHSDIAKKTGKYYGSLEKEEKDEVLAEFKSGELQFVLATKAFGMGIDIPDITNVYHYAPTGNVVDYIQEIGRAARDKKLVPVGYGITDFLKYDMNEVNRLYGMSAIKRTEILDVMRKVLSVYKEKKNNRNIILSPEDFKYIFVDNKRDENSLDNKVKTVLLMIEKDFSSPNKLGYSPFVARPRSVFGNDLIFVNQELENKFIKSELSQYFYKVFDLDQSGNNYSAVYQVNLSGIWEKYYSRMSFPSFKYSLFTTDELEKLEHSNLFKKFSYCSGIQVNFSGEAADIVAEYKRVLRSFSNFLDQQRITAKQFTVNDLGNYLMRDIQISDKFEARSLSQVLINASFEFEKIKEITFLKERANSSEDQPRFKVVRDSEIFSDFMLLNLNAVINPNQNFKITDDVITSFYHRIDHNKVIDSRIASLGLGESLGILNYQVIGGNNPQIYLRMNSVYPLEQAIKKGNRYKNHILDDVKAKHYTSVEMLKYLFTKEQPESDPEERVINYSQWFWNNIEDYFMGKLPDKVQSQLSKQGW